MAPPGVEARALPPRVPEATREQERAAVQAAAYKAEREQVERRRQVRGLIVLAVVVLVWSVARAGVDRVFTQGWWRLW